MRSSFSTKRSLPVACAFVGLALCAATASGQDAAKNLLKNGDIEVGTNDVPNDWKPGAKVDGVAYEWAGKTGYKSSHSLCLRKTAARYFPIASWNQSFAHDGRARKLHVSAYVRAENVTKAVLDVSYNSAA